MKTLFIRNIGWDVTDAEFKEFMLKFGPVRYTVLNKSVIRGGSGDGQSTHRGTGFVLYKEAKVAD